MKFLTFILFIIIACNGCENVPEGRHAYWKTIEVGDYLFDFPPGFQLKPEQGIDSYVGKVKSDSMEFSFDFGYYTGQPQTTQEYLDSGMWRFELSEKFMKPGVTYGSGMPYPKVDVLSIRPATISDSSLSGGCDYVAKCKHDSTNFDYPVFIPAELKGLVYKIDTIDNQYIKIVYTPNLARNGASIYIRNIKGFSTSMNSYLALGMGTGNLSVKQLQLALDIFSTVRRKKADK